LTKEKRQEGYGEKTKEEGQEGIKEQRLKD
jgi:hypothetical protein